MANKTPEISVVIPCYNVEEYIERIVRNFAEQSCDNSFFEVIFVDDGSKDGTGDLLDYHCQHYSNMHVHHQLNKGVSAARNKGIELSRGKYIYFCDPDDLTVPGLISWFQSKLEENIDLELIIFGYTETDIQNLKKKNRQGKPEGYFKSTEFYLILETLDQQNLINPPWNKLFKKEVIEKNCIRFPPIRRGEDAIFNLEYIQYAKNVLVCEKVLYEYYTNRTGSAESKSDIRDISDFELMTEMKKKIFSLYQINVNNFEAKSLVRYSYYEMCKLFQKLETKSLEEFLYELKKRKINDRISTLNIKQFLNLDIKLKMKFITLSFPIFFYYTNKFKK